MDNYHACKLCFRRFSTGRALGGHMRSHVAPTNHQPSPTLLQQHSSSSSSSGAAAASGGFYGLRENPRRSIKFADPEFAAVDYGESNNNTTATNNSASVVVQDRESETESSVPPCSVRRRSKRIRRQTAPQPPEVEIEPVSSSVSDASPDEDVARCLVMLSRDFWSKKEEELMALSEGGGGGGGEGGGRTRFQCRACKKEFRSYQALGGHRASHKRIKSCVAVAEEDDEYGREIRRDGQEQNAGGGGDDRRTHECPFCYRVFGSGQALGGHKRSHLATGSYQFPPPPPSSSAAGKKDGESLIDLNLPAPIEDEDLEFSAVSDTTP